MIQGGFLRKWERSSAKAALSTAWGLDPRGIGTLPAVDDDAARRRKLEPGFAHPCGHVGCSTAAVISTLTQDEAGAVYNYLLVARGGASGVHNTTYIAQLLDKSYFAFTGFRF